MSNLNLVYSHQSAQYALLPEHLAAAEKCVFEKKKSTKSRQQYLSSRGFIKNHLAKHFQVDSNSLSVSFDKYRQLLIAYRNNQPLAWLSLSHSGDSVAMIFSESALSLIGIDIETVNKQRNFFALAELSMTGCEYKQIIESSNICLSFYSQWTLKEAISKATKLTLPSVFHKRSENLLHKFNLTAMSFKHKDAVSTVVFPQNKQVNIWNSIEQ